MTSHLPHRVVLLAALLSAATACVSAEPVVMSSQFAPPGGASWVHRSRADAPAPCRVALVDVSDIRHDTTSMGSMSGRPVRAANAAGWLRSGIETLKEDTRIQLVGAEATDARVSMTAELVKAYVSSVTTEKVGSVVVRVRYTQDGAPAGEQVFRGDHNGINWAAGDGEAHDVLNSSLKEVIASIDKDLLARCAPSPAGPAATAQ